MKLLEQTVRELKGEDVEDDLRATVNLGVDLRIDETYVADMNQRLMLYRKVAASRKEEEIDHVLDEAVDRYGPLPDSVLNLADYGRIRVIADKLGVESVDREGRTVVIKFRPQAKVDPVRLVALVRQRRDLTLVPPGALRLNLDGAQDLRSAARLRNQRGRSWWTARAKETEVRPGFTKAEMTRTAKEDPRATGGLFERVGSVLSELL
jgi:transcription-repair coupling factor (superfamily II helicase)